MVRRVRVRERPVKVTFEEHAHLTDDGWDYTPGVVVCSECGALVDQTQRDRHRAWHGDAPVLGSMR